MKLKDEQEPEYTLEETLRRHIANLGTVVDERWWIEEYIPSYNTGGYYDEDIPEQVVSTSRFFDNEADARQHLSRCTPDTYNGKTAVLRIRHQKCYEKTVRKWI